MTRKKNLVDFFVVLKPIEADYRFGLYRYERGTVIFESSLISAVKGQVSCLMGEEAVILHLKSGVYFGLNPVASRIWSLIHEPKLIKSIHETLLSEFEIDSSRCESDLMNFLKRMHAVDLIQVEHDAAA